VNYNFYDLFSRLKSDNDIAQRNLHIQGCAPAGGASFWSMLPWVQMANPFADAATACIEIDTSQIPKVEGLSLGLSLEVEGELEREIKLGESQRELLAEALLPEDHLILRLRATLSLEEKGEEEGEEEDTTWPTFSIDLRFFVGDELITGYRHLLRIVPLEEAVAQVLDKLYGALRSVQAGCQVNTQDLVEQVNPFIAAAANDPRRALGELCARAASFTGLAESLEGLVGNGEKYEAVHRHLSRLAALLSDSSDNGSPKLASGVSPNVLAEQIRDLADRIQEPAGRLAHRRQAA
jgi:hypothetical protein